MVNLFVSIDQQLSDIGWKKKNEDDKGFHFLKKIGVDNWYSASFKERSGIRFYDPMILGRDYDSICVDEKELELFSAKIKEWRKQHERDTKAGRHYRKERS